MKFTLAFALAILSLSLQAQFITHGPVVGGVTPTSARIYVRTNAAMPVELKMADNVDFNNAIVINDSTRALRDNSIIIDVAGLQPYTTYYYGWTCNGQPEFTIGHFKTFPEVGQRDHFTWGVLSCQEYGTYNTFQSVFLHQPDLILHNGDWTYPDYQIPGDFRLDWAKLQLSYRKRYEEPQMEPVFHSSVFDYVVDNHDGIDNLTNNASVSFSVDGNGMVTNYINYDPTPPGAFQLMMDAYDEYFPSYPLPAPNVGMYHSYRYGNAEVFFVDVRNCGNGQDSTYRYDATTNGWYFDPRPGQTLLGQQQLTWLKNGLQNSTADWKFIVSGVMFNRKFRKVLEYAMIFQNLQFDLGGQNGTGFRLAHAISCNWAGYPAEQDGLLAFLDDNNINDVVVLSGHMHTNVMDNGSNAGLPELNTGPAASTGPELTYYVDSIMQVLGQGSVFDSIWNGGGMGVNNTNFKSGWGKVEIFGNDSIVMKTIDEDNVDVSSMTILHSSKVTSVPAPQPATACVVESVFPNPAKGYIDIQYCKDYKPKSADRATIIDMNGRVVRNVFPASAGTRINLDGVALGNYLFIYDYGDFIYHTKIVVAK
jgi:PhoD-like phosphatase/Secretion system C-terminal sorting domain